MQEAKIKHMLVYIREDIERINLLLSESDNETISEILQDIYDSVSDIFEYAKKCNTLTVQTYEEIVSFIQEIFLIGEKYHI
jgi:uncharacterized protein YutE (UPF0331/DUF86 family)